MMPLKLIGFILLIFILLVFVGVNLDNFANINIWFNEKGQFEDVSVIVIVFSAYLLGIFSTLPFWFTRSRKKSREAKKKALKGTTEILPSSKESDPDESTKISPPKRKFLPKKKRTLADKNS